MVNEEQAQRTKEKNLRVKRELRGAVINKESIGGNWDFIGQWLFIS